ncbi:MAG: hypothetical protein F4X11_08000 [Acidobacteria bacterium]|nr:hypothetical protein [Acidobacteriota bacterium]
MQTMQTEDPVHTQQEPQQSMSPDLEPAEELRVLRERQDAMEMILVLLANNWTNLGVDVSGTLEEMLSTMRRTEAPQFKTAVEVFDNVNRALLKIAQGRRSGSHD